MVTYKSKDIIEQPPLLIRSNPTADQIRLISVREIIMIILGERSKSSSVSKISTSLYSNHHHRCVQLPLSEGIMECEFFKKFTIPSFNCYSGQSNLIQHFHQYQDKMVIYAQSDPILCRIFPSSFKGVAFDWFYSLQPDQYSTSRI